MSLYRQIDDNKKRTWVILAVFIAFFSLVGYIWGWWYNNSWSGLTLALVFSSFSGLFSYYFSDRVILAISGAKEIEAKRQAPELYRTVENLCLGSGLPLPKIYVLEDSAPNAFATGRDPAHAVICVTTGLLDKLDRAELEGVVAHELSHIKNFDIRLMSLVAVLVGSVALLADWGFRFSGWGGGRRRRGRGGSSGQLGGLLMLGSFLLLILSPLIAQLMKLALSRQREFSSDADAALLTRNPRGLISALRKISADQEPLEAANRATAHLYIASPFKGGGGEGWLVGLFSTHPKIEDRIARLRAM